MARELSPCGTPAAYSRHLSAGEEPCEACRAANAHRVAQQRAKAVQDDVERLERGRRLGREPEEGLLGELRRLQGIVTAALEVAKPNEVAALAKQAAALAEQIEREDRNRENEDDPLAQFLHGPPTIVPFQRKEVRHG